MQAEEQAVGQAVLEVAGERWVLDRRSSGEIWVTAAEACPAAVQPALLFGAFLGAERERRACSCGQF